MTCAITIRDVTKNYGSTEVLRSIDLDIPTGAVTAVLGASGSGKTTLLRLIAGFDTIDAGALSIAGRLVDDGRRTVRSQYRGIGYVPQDAALFPHLTVLANIGFGVPRGRRAGLADLIELVGLTGYENRHPHQLSGGQQQRVALARALAIKPKVVLLDEPFSSLDAALRDSVRADVVRILADSGTTTVLVTHDQDEALSLADHIALISDGRVAAGGTPDDLYRHPPTPDIAAAVGLANIIAGRLDAGQVQSMLGTLAVHPACRSAVHADCEVLVRPEQLALGTAARPGSVEARVRRLRYHGHDTLIELEFDPPAPDGDVVTLTARTPGRPVFQVHQPAHVTVSGDVHAWVR